MELEQAIERINEFEKKALETSLKIQEQDMTISNYEKKLSEVEGLLKTSRELSVKLAQENSTLRFTPSQTPQPQQQPKDVAKVMSMSEMLNKL